MKRFWNWIREDLTFEGALLSIGVIAILVLVICLLVITVVAEKVTLFKADWNCTQIAVRNNIILVGKAAVPTTETICTQYTRK